MKMLFDRNRPFNSLPLLPPVKDVSEKTVVLKALVKASRALAKVDGYSTQLPNKYMLINTIALQEAKTSTEIENIFTTNDELYRAISSETKLAKINKGTKEVIRYREALWAGFHNLKTKKSIELGLILDIVKAIKKTDEGIRSPQALTVIRRGNSDHRAGEVVYTPPRGEGVLEHMLDDLLGYLNAKNDTEPLIKMAIAHYQFESIHPFRDGNGRTGRILNLLYLVNQGLLTDPILYLSRHIIDTKDEYYYQLGAVRHSQDLTSWVLYMLEAVEKTSLQTMQLIDDIGSQMRETLAYGKLKFPWYSKEINELIFTQPYTKAANLGTLLNRSSRTTINTYLASLTNAKILRYEKIGNQVYYVNDDLVNILES